MDQEYSFIENIKRRHLTGQIEDTYMSYLRDWKQNMDMDAVEHCFDTLFEKGYDDEACELLFDEDYLLLKKEHFEWKIIESEFDRAVNHFLLKKNIYKYLYVRLLSRLPDLLGDNYTKNICESYRDFLQIDTPHALRKNIGLQKFFTSLFPITLEVKSEMASEFGSELASEPGFETTTVKYVFEFIEYKLGDWLGPGDLNIFGEINEGRVDVLQHDIPLYIVIRDKNAMLHTLHLMNLPLMFFITRKNGRIGFQSPGYFLIMPKQFQKVDIMGVSPDCTYDRKKDLIGILVAILSRSIRQRGQLKKAMGRRILRLLDKKEQPTATTSLTNLFKRTLLRVLYNTQSDEIDYVADFSSVTSLVTEAIPSSENLSKSIWLNNRLFANPKGLSGLIDFHILSVPIKLDERLQKPDANIHLQRDLDEYGIIKPGSQIKYGDILLLKSTISEDDGPEEKLLRAIFGDIREADASYRWSYPAMGRVIFYKTYIRNNPPKDKFLVNCYTTLSKASGDVELKDKSFFKDDEWAKVNLFVETGIPFNIGDLIYNESDEPLIVSGIVNEVRSLAGDMADARDCIVFGRSENNVGVRTYSWKVSDSITYLNQVRSIGEYRLIANRPVVNNGSNSAQFLHPKAIVYLYEHGARAFISELLIARSDGIVSKKKLYDGIVQNGTIRLSHVFSPITCSLRDLDSQSLRNLYFYLQVFRINLMISDGADAAVHFTVFSDQELVAMNTIEVTKAETKSERTKRPIPGGLFCEKIFGGQTGQSDRMGHIALARPVVFRHLLPDNVSKICAVLSFRPEDINDIIDHKKKVVRLRNIKNEDTLSVFLVDKDISITDGHDQPDAITETGTGAEGITIICSYLEDQGVSDPDIGGIMQAIARRILVIPPGMRPMYFKDGKWWTIDLNELYRRVVQQNNWVKRIINDHNYNKSYLNHEYERLQEAVDNLFGWNPLPKKNNNIDRKDRTYKGLQDILPGYSGSYLLGRAYDYSARTRMAVNPALDIDECELPVDLALRVYEPFLVFHLLNTGKASSAEAATAMLNQGEMPFDEICTALNGKIATVFMKAKEQYPCFSFICRISRLYVLRFAPALLEIVNPKMLGTIVKIIPPMAEESIEEAKALFPSRQLANRSTVEESKMDEIGFSIDSIEDFRKKINQKMPLSGLDKLLMR